MHVRERQPIFVSSAERHAPARRRAVTGTAALIAAVGIVTLVFGRPPVGAVMIAVALAVTLLAHAPRRR
jgi:hypothetical protein